MILFNLKMIFFNVSLLHLKPLIGSFLLIIIKNKLGFPGEIWSGLHPTKDYVTTWWCFFFSASDLWDSSGVCTWKKKKFLFFLSGVWGQWIIFMITVLFVIKSWWYICWLFEIRIRLTGCLQIFFNKIIVKLI